MARKALSKKTRFEVFKRDGFVCQYCGAHPPSTILHVDHIHPVAAGGGNEIDNLVTACQSCNLGKSANLLTDIPQSLQDKAKQVIEREEQIKGYQKALDAKRSRIETEADAICEIYELFNKGFTLSEKSMVTVRHFIEQLGLHDVRFAMEKAMTTRVRGGGEFKYFCGICWNKIRNAS
jgi:5-methylcytosine-specific restriction endonuclease McrA